MAENFYCFSRWVLLPIFQPSRPLSGNALKKKKAFRSPPACVPPCRQMMRTRSGSSGRSGGQAPKHAGLPASGSFQLRTKPLRMSSSSRAVSNSLTQGILPPRRHSARTSGRRPCAARWDAVVTASCEAFCEPKRMGHLPERRVTTTASCEAFCECVSSLSSSSIHPVTTTASCEAFCEHQHHHHEPQAEVTTTASCEAFCEACLFLSIYFRQCKGLFSGGG